MELIKELLYAVILTVIPILTTYLGKFLYAKWEEIKVNINNEQTKLILDQVTDMIIKTVQKTNQVMVDELKKKGTFDEKAAKDAFITTKATVLGMLSQDAKEIIANVYGNLDTYLDTFIEATVKELK